MLQYHVLLEQSNKSPAPLSSLFANLRSSSSSTPISIMMASPPNPQVILCTGANRSLGFAIILSLAERLPPATYILGSRSLEAGYAAADELRKLCSKAKVRIEALELDVTDDKSIFAAVDVVQEKYGKLDGLLRCPLSSYQAFTR
jgi:NADP-dependent 3-hydroxy acid dehydrogenase YdfG